MAAIKAAFFIADFYCEDEMKKQPEPKEHPEYKHNMPLRATGVAAAIILLILFFFADQ